MAMGLHTSITGRLGYPHHLEQVSYRKSRGGNNTKVGAQNQDEMRDISRTLINSLCMTDALETVYDAVSKWEKGGFSQNPEEALSSLNANMRFFPSVSAKWKRTLEQICNKHNLDMRLFEVEV
jgi:hypothetical protein